MIIFISKWFQNTAFHRLSKQIISCTRISIYVKSFQYNKSTQLLVSCVSSISIALNYLLRRYCIFITPFLLYHLSLLVM